jgi:hypothetical protein
VPSEVLGVLKVETRPCTGTKQFRVGWQRRTVDPFEFRKHLRTSVIPGEHEANMAYCGGERLKRTEPGGGSGTATAGGCTGGALIRICRLSASSALSIPRWLVGWGQGGCSGLGVTILGKYP